MQAPNAHPQPRGLTRFSGARQTKLSGGEGAFLLGVATFSAPHLLSSTTDEPLDIDSRALVGRSAIESAVVLVS
jgi:hypothetical protein